MFAHSGRYCKVDRTRLGARNINFRVASASIDTRALELVGRFCDFWHLEIQVWLPQARNDATSVREVGSSCTRYSCARSGVNSGGLTAGVGALTSVQRRREI